MLRKQSENQAQTEKDRPGKVVGDAGNSNGTEKEKFRKNHEQKLKFTWAEQKEYETIEEDIAALEEKIQQCDKEMAKFAADFVKLGELSRQKEEAQEQLDYKMDRWMYLEELAAKIAGQ